MRPFGICAVWLAWIWLIARGVKPLLNGPDEFVLAGVLLIVASTLAAMMATNYLSKGKKR